jgi:NAD(P)-dependent dehydrogenase (short-subunit alcohol dehydrogenase family)
VTEQQQERRRVAVVTGGSAGLGRAIVREFAQRGWDVGVLARGRAGLDGAVADVERIGTRAIGIETDVADRAAVEAAADRVEAELGEIDVWVNDAMVGVFGEFLDTDPDDFERAVSVDFLGFVNGTRAALSRMKPRNRGGVVQVGSALAHRGIPLQAAYCSSKHAIKGFTESVLTELLHDGSAVTLSEVDMPAMNTIQFNWVKSKLPKHAQPVPADLPARDLREGRGRCRGAPAAADLGGGVDRVDDHREPARNPGRRLVSRSDGLLRAASRGRRPPHADAEPLRTVERGRPGRARRVRPPVVAHHAADVGDPAPPARLLRRRWRHRRGRGDRLERGAEGCTVTTAPGPLAVEGVRALLGTTDLVLPGRLAVSPGRGGRPFPSALHRVLGARQVVQAVLTARAGTVARQFGGSVDALHALSMVVVAACSSRYRRAAITQVVLASGLALLEFRAASADTEGR